MKAFYLLFGIVTASTAILEISTEPRHAILGLVIAYFLLDASGEKK